MHIWDEIRGKSKTATTTIYKERYTDKVGNKKEKGIIHMHHNNNNTFSINGQEPQKIKSKKNIKQRQRT